MAQKIKLLSEAPINGETYPKGKVLSVSESISESLKSQGLAEDYVPEKVKDKDQKEG